MLSFYHDEVEEGLNLNRRNEIVGNIQNIVYNLTAPYFLMYILPMESIIIHSFMICSALSRQRLFNMKIVSVVCLPSFRPYMENCSDGHFVNKRTFNHDKIYTTPTRSEPIYLIPLAYQSKKMFFFFHSGFIELSYAMW